MTKAQGGSFSRRQFLAATVGATALSAASVLMVPTVRAATPKQGGTLRFGVGHGSSTDSLDPGTYDNNFTIALGYMLNNHLAEISANGELIGEVAESWEPTPDAATWTFKIRKGIVYHDGRSLTVEDVVASVNYHRGEGSKSAALALLKPIKDIKIDGPDKVVFSLNAGNADFPYIISDYHIPILPSKDGKIVADNGIGCGPYKLEKWQPGIQARVTRNPNYWKTDRAHFDAIEMTAIVDATARTAAMMSGTIDVMDRCEFKTVSFLEKNPAVSVKSISGNQHYTFPMLTNKAPFDDPHVRMALKLACPREQMVKTILQGHGAVGNDHPIGSGMPFFAAGLPQRTQDLDKAKWHLKQAGLTSLNVQLSAADAAFSGAVDAAELYSQAAAKGGIKIDVERVPNDGYWANVWTKKPWCACYWAGRPTVDAMLSLAYLPDGAWNDTNWKNPRFVELVTAGRAELDAKKRAQIYFDAQEILSNDGGTVVPMFADYLFATSNKIKHDKIASNWDMDGQKFSERWWFE
ncbi:ABC transporter substrate-binding protein [Mesorhizobium kowhaii]|uniref:Peptide ABC transporter substrate-binding protein n=1 Tax=Mesorhizobium kowhaii TaxID=1300272 RepID=A0A2W7CFI3_9HYPH|nr:ABC transporter substrate-binding protein [Mesorhizobium kowhaii]PZV35263.1 peptide ABC transporter substrate-binding protein [Mesorhizobium kowhaii]